MCTKGNMDLPTYLDRMQHVISSILETIQHHALVIFDVSEGILDSSYGCVQPLVRFCSFTNLAMNLLNSLGSGIFY